MDVMVVGRRAQQRWWLTGALGLDPAVAAAPDLAASRLAHPSTDPPDVVLLVLDDAQDLAWLDDHTRRNPRGWVPVVAVLTRPGLATAARRVGARATVVLSEPGPGLTRDLRRAISEATAPAVVIHLDAVRSA